jgi:hypothetical protein
VPAGSTSGGSTLNLTALPDSIQHIVRAAYGDATGHIFLISAAIAVVGVIAAALMRPAPLRSTVDAPASAPVESATEKVPALSN